MFSHVAGKFPKKIGAAYENSDMFHKFFYADAETSKWPFFCFNEKLFWCKLYQNPRSAALSAPIPSYIK